MIPALEAVWAQRHRNNVPFLLVAAWLKRGAWCQEKAEPGQLEQATGLRQCQGKGESDNEQVQPDFRTRVPSVVNQGCPAQLLACTVRPRGPVWMMGWAGRLKPFRAQGGTLDGHGLHITIRAF